MCNGVKPFEYKKVAKRKIFEFSFKKGESLVEICSWVLMDNHFHLLVYLPENKSTENVSKFMSKLLSAYLKFFNEKYKRTGGLFEGRFQSILVEEDLYLKYLFSYIHLNPLKMLNNNWKVEGLKIKNAQAYLEDYKFSSFHDLVSRKKRYEFNILTSDHKVLEISKNANSLESLFSLLRTPGGPHK